MSVGSAADWNVHINSENSESSGGNKSSPRNRIRGHCVTFQQRPCLSPETLREIEFEDEGLINRVQKISRQNRIYTVLDAFSQIHIRIEGKGAGEMAQ